MQFLCEIKDYLCRQMKILVIEDEPGLRDLMVRTLTEERHVVEQAATFSEAETRLAGYDYDCVLLDIMLPGGSGLTLLEDIRKQGNSVNVIILSAKDSLDDKILGLELGADDYLPKPFHIAELTARVRSVARRLRGGQKNLVRGNVTLDPEACRVQVAGQNLELLRKEFDILAYFMQRPGHLIDKAVLAEAVWGDRADESDNFHFIYGQMKNLRRKLSEAGADIEIRSVYGFGYKLIDSEEDSKA